MPIDPYEQLQNVGAFIPLVKPEPDTRIWRYMDFYKFLALIRINIMVGKFALFFPQLSKLEDQYEGTLGYLLKEHFLHEKAHQPNLEGQQDIESSMKMGSKLQENFRESSIVTCWYISRGESMGMWKTYGSRGYSIAIQSTVERLNKALEIPNDAVMVSSKVFYSLQEMKLWWNDPYLTMLLKRSEFAFEQEYRIILDKILTDRDRLIGGKYISVDVQTLIENVYVDPNAPKWVFNLIKEVTIENIGLEATQIRQSNIARKPDW